MGTPSPFDTGFFVDDIDLNDTRKQDTVAYSTSADAIAVVDAFRSSTASSPWTSLDRTQVADRLTQIVSEPRVIAQGSLNLCGPAAFFNIVALRHPLAVAEAATSLFDTGSANIGGLHIEPSSALTSADYAAMVTLMVHGITPQADWMLLGALRNTTNVFWQPAWRGDPDQELAGATRPEELASWLRSTGLFTSVVDGGKWASNPGIPNAENLATSVGNDNALLINTNLLAAAMVAVATPAGQPPTLRSAGIDSADHTFLLSAFPNHWVTLLNGIASSPYPDPQGGHYVLLSLWTWGRSYLSLWVPQRDFLDNYYGAVNAFVQSA
jgi:hypothetical protein